MKKAISPASLVPYTQPQLCTTNEKDRFVWFRFYHDGKWTNPPIRCREGINRIKDKGEKKKYGEALRDARHDWLKMGWNANNSLNTLSN